MIIRDLRGIESTQDACAKIRVKPLFPFLLCLNFYLLYLPLMFSSYFQKSKDSRKGPVVILSITYRGVKFIDAATKVIGKNVIDSPSPYAALVFFSLH